MYHSVYMLIPETQFYHYTLSFSNWNSKMYMSMMSYFIILIIIIHITIFSLEVLPQKFGHRIRQRSMHRWNLWCWIRLGWITSGSSTPTTPAVLCINVTAVVWDLMRSVLIPEIRTQLLPSVCVDAPELPYFIRHPWYISTKVCIAEVQRSQCLASIPSSPSNLLYVCCNKTL